jgi:uncharacterized protein (DUF433 family)
MTEATGHPGPHGAHERSIAADIITSHPSILGGEPCYIGTRVPVATVVAYLDAGHSEDEIFQDFPTLPINAITVAHDWRKRGER